LDLEDILVREALLVRRVREVREVYPDRLDYKEYPEKKEKRVTEVMLVDPEKEEVEEVPELKVHPELLGLLDQEAKGVPKVKLDEMALPEEMVLEVSPEGLGLSDETGLVEQPEASGQPGREDCVDSAEEPESAENVVAWAREVRPEAED